jgi:hypothetical protein
MCFSFRLLQSFRINKQSHLVVTLGRDQGVYLFREQEYVSRFSAAFLRHLAHRLLFIYRISTATLTYSASHTILDIPRFPGRLPIRSCARVALPTIHKSIRAKLASLSNFLFTIFLVTSSTASHSRENSRVQLQDCPGSLPPICSMGHGDWRHGNRRQGPRQWARNWYCYLSCLHRGRVGDRRWSRLVIVGAE